VTALLRKLRDGAAAGGFDGVKAISFATQTNSFRLYDAEDKPWCPMVLWPDERAMNQAARVEQIVRTNPNFRQQTGIPNLSGQFMLAKLINWSEHNMSWPEVRRVCLIGDALTLWFTGQHVTEAGAAGLTGMVDIHQLEWIDAIVAETKLDPSYFPKVMYAGSDLGAIRKEAAEELGLPRDCRFVLGCLDQFAGAVGAGNIVNNNVSETTGTVLATVRCADRVDTTLAPEIFQGPGFSRDIVYHMVFGSTSANLLEWFRNQLPEKPDYDVLTREAANVPPGAEGLKLRPGADSGALADGFIGMTPRHTRGHQVRCILETVAQALAQQVEQLCGSELPREIRSCGGAARSDLWLQIKADTVNAPFVALTCPEPTSLGAAILAGHGLGWGTVAELAQRWPHFKSPHMPSH
jgi:xylulokinase